MGNKNQFVFFGLERLESRWLLSSGIAPLAHGSIWQIRGDRDLQDLNDTISLSIDPAHPKFIQATVNGKTIARHRASGLRRIAVHAGMGENIVAVNIGQHPGVRLKVFGYGQNKVADAGGIAGGLSNGNVSGLEHAVDQAQLKQWLIDAAVQQYRNLFGTTTPYYGGGWYSAVTFNATAAAAGTATPDSFHSDTNVQVAGVDEADLVETDGRYIYTLSGNQVVIVKPGDSRSHLRIVSKTPIDGWNSALGMYLEKNELVIVGSSDVTMLDVSNPAAPKVSQHTHFDGSVISSRVVDGRLYVAISINPNLPSPTISPVSSTQSSNDPQSQQGDTQIALTYVDQQGIYESEDEYRQQLSAWLDQQPLGAYTTLSADGSTTGGSLIAGSGVYRSAGGNDASNASTSVTTLAVFNIDERGAQPGPAASVSLLNASGSIVYATANSMYVASPMYWTSYTTRIVKFGLSKGHVSVQAVGEVSGRPLNQYSLDEDSKGLLRIATTNGWGSASTNSLYVLRQDGGRLVQVGSIEGIDPGENLQAARFIGDRAYLVTFLRRDPLVTVDLSDPAAPKITGKLEVDGYSEYLQPVGDHLLLGIGTESHELEISLFDVSDPAEAKVLSVYHFNDANWASSQAEYDPHAVSWFADKEILAIPLQSTNESGDAFFKIDPTNGIQKVGLISQPGNQRTVRIGQNVFAFGASDIREAALDDPSQIIDKLALPQPVWNTYYPIGTTITPISSQIRILPIVSQPVLLSPGPFPVL